MNSLNFFLLLMWHLDGNYLLILNLWHNSDSFHNTLSYISFKIRINVWNDVKRMSCQVMHHPSTTTTTSTATHHIDTSQPSSYYYHPSSNYYSPDKELTSFRKRRISNTEKYFKEIDGKRVSNYYWHLKRSNCWITVDHKRNFMYYQI